MTDIDGKSKKMQTKKSIAREVADLCMSSIPFLPEELQEWKSIMRRLAIKGVGFRKTRLLAANLERSGVVVTVKATTVSGSSACPSQSDFGTRLIPITAPSRRSAVVYVPSLDDFGRSTVANLDNVIDVIAHGHKQIEKQFAPILHLHLHGSAPLESLTTPDDQGKVMSAEP